MGKKAKTIAIWVALILVFLVSFDLMNADEDIYPEDFSVFLEHLEGGRVGEVRANSNELTVTLWDSGTRYTTLGVVDEELTRKLSEQGVLLTWGEESRPMAMLLSWGLPLVLLLGVFIYFLKKAQGGTGNILALRRTTARTISESSKVTFADIGGAAKAKDELGDLIDYLKHSKRWVEAGVRLPRGVLLEGPPGCGKTLLARAVAGEAGVPFFTVSASEFVEMFVGIGAARVRDTFETAAKQAPAVIFIDELDAVGRRRGTGIGAGHDEREQTLNQLLVSLDGFEHHKDVVVLAASNRVDVLDKALLRAGRFDSRIQVPLPTRNERRETLEIHTRGRKLGDSVSLGSLADKTDNYTGADLESLTNDAARLAVRRARTAGEQEIVIEMQDFNRALEPAQARTSRFTQLDSAIIESASQLAQPTGKAIVRLELREGTLVEGELVWADATFIKVRNVADATETIIPKYQVQKLEALQGTELARAGDVVGDRWANRMPDLA